MLTSCKQSKSDQQKVAAVFSLNPRTHACPIIRIINPLSANEWRVHWCAEKNKSSWSFDLESAKKSDIIIIQRHFPSAFTTTILKNLLKLNKPIIYETDDLFLKVPKSHASHESLKMHRPYIKWIIKSADIIVTSTETLKIALKKYTTKPIHVLKNTIDESLFFSSPDKKTSDFNILIAGTSTHQSDWEIIKAPLLKILQVHQGNVNAIFFGDLPSSFQNNSSSRLIEFQDSYKQYAHTLKSLSIQVALVPLEETSFNNCKSNIKWLEYSMAGIPGIYSNITPYNSCIRNEETGLLVDNTETAWFNAIDSLLKNPEHANNIAINSQTTVLDEYTIKKLPQNYFSLFDNLIGKGHKRKVRHELSILPTLMRKKILFIVSTFLNKHFFWRLKPDHRK